MKHVYADYNATSPCPPGHTRKVMSLLDKIYANPSSIHQLGREAKLSLEEARLKIAQLLGAEKNTIFFTSGATESNNTVIQGIVHEHFHKTGKKAKIAISNAEHASVYQVAEILQKRGLCEIVYLPVNELGFLEEDTVLKALSKDILLVSFIHVNNETGAITPVQTLVEAIRKKLPQVHIHIDAVQSYGKLDLSWVAQSNIDTLAISGHKIGAFKGVGALYKKRGLNLIPLIYGGGQERGWRSGTENLPGILSFGIRAEERVQIINKHSFESLRSEFLQSLEQIPTVHIHSKSTCCIPTTVNFHVEGLSGEELLLSFDAAKVYVSNGSACASGGGRPSHVLKAMGYSDAEATQSVRLSFGEESTKEDLEIILKTLRDLVRWKKR